MTNITVKKSEPPESKEILADAIIRISDGLSQLQRSGLNNKAIMVLVKDATGLAMRDIKLVIDSLARLKGWYCR